MMRLFSDKKALEVIEREGDWIATVSKRYGVPEATIKAMLFQEMTMSDALDPVADFVAWLGFLPKKDSSTGYAQIFGYVGVNAINFAVDLGLATYESLGIDADHRLDPKNHKDVRTVWKKLHHEPHANIEIATLNLLAAADEVVGRIDFDSFSPEEMQLVFSRYNANVRHVTAYGEKAYKFYEAFRDGDGPTVNANRYRSLMK